jgi:hypothetical protein
MSTTPLKPQPSPLPPSLVPDWRLTAELAAKEMDSAKLARLIEQLCRELDEAKR